MILTCFQNGTVDHTGSRAAPSRIAIIHENADWYIRPPRVVYGKAENGGTYFGCDMPTMPNVRASLAKAGVFLEDQKDYTGRIVWDHESMSPDINDPFDIVNRPVRWRLSRVEYDDATEDDIHREWTNTSNAYHKQLWRLIRQACPKATIGRYGYPLVDHSIDAPAMLGTHKHIEFPYISLHGYWEWTEAHVERAREWAKQFRSNTSRKPCIQHHPNTRNIAADRALREPWSRLWESDEFDLVLWEDVSHPTTRAAIERYIQEEFPA